MKKIPDLKFLPVPLSRQEIDSLRAGDIVSLSGTLYTARDAAHKRFYDTIVCGKPLPIDLSTAAIYYAGPSPATSGMPIGSCGPTTSSRMDRFTPLLLEKGLRVMIGKGKRSDTVQDAIVRHGAIYLCAVGGAGALYQSTVMSCKTIAYPELGCEAVYELQVKSFEVVVGIDSRGNTILR